MDHDDRHSQHDYAAGERLSNRGETPGPSAAKGKRIRILHVEDSADDAALIRRELERGGFLPDILRVETRAQMEAALQNVEWDLIISDHSLPTFNAPEAFQLLRTSGRDIPFIMVSGTIGESFAVEVMRSGIHDFVLKDNLRRLPVAVDRELRDAAARAEQRKMRQQLLVSERMASVGTLAAGVAHEINNPLGVVIGNLECVRRDLDSVCGLLEGGDDVALHLSEVKRVLAGMREAVGDMREAATQVDSIVRDVRLFSRNDDEARVAVDVLPVMESSIRMARNEIRNRAQLVREYGKVPAVYGNAGRLGQVFLNLLVNAAQAFPDTSSERNLITVRTSLSGSRVLVEVTDTGGGIPPDVLPHVFDLFFTTKPIGIGTGLGLAICQRIVNGMGGWLDVESRVGHGTTVSVVLPTTAEDEGG